MIDNTSPPQVEVAPPPDAEVEAEKTLDSVVEEAVKYLLQQAATSRAAFHGD